MTMRRIFTLGFLALAVAPPRQSTAAGVSQAGRGASQGGGVAAPTRDRQPFKNLFPDPFAPGPEAAQKPLFKVRPVPSNATAGARVMCGMTVLPVDPAFDQAIRQPLAEAAPRSAMRADRKSVV